MVDTNTKSVLSINTHGNRYWRDNAVQLARYLTDHRLSQDDFAALVGVSQVAVSRWVSGVRMPRPEHLARIAAATGGAVTANDFMDGVVADEHDDTPPCNGRAA